MIANLNMNMGNLRGYECRLSSIIDDKIGIIKRKIHREYIKLIKLDINKFVESNSKKLFEFLLQKEIEKIIYKKRSAIDQRVYENSKGKYKGLDKSLDKMSTWSAILTHPTSKTHIHHGQIDKSFYGSSTLSKQEYDDLLKKFTDCPKHYSLSDLLDIGFVPCISELEYTINIVSPKNNLINAELYPLSKVICETLMSGETSCRNNTTFKIFCAQRFNDVIIDWDRFYDPNLQFDI